MKAYLDEAASGNTARGARPSPQLSAPDPSGLKPPGTDRKVLIIVENQAVPFDPRVWKEACSLSRSGYQVTVLCPRKTCKQWHEVIDGVEVYRYPNIKDGNNFFGYLLEYSWAFTWEFLYTCWIYLRRGFHVVQGCNPPDNIFLIALPFKLLGVKYIFDHHDISPELYLSKFGRKNFLHKLMIKFEKLTYRFSDVVMCTNGSYKNLAVTRGGRNPADVFIIRNGPEPDSFKAVAPNPALKYGKPYLVGYVGAMGLQDGLDILVDVARYIKQLGRCDIHFTCIGSGGELPRLRKMVQTGNLEDTIDFTGRISDEKMIEILSTADICVNPDRPCVMNDMSTMIKVMEYMALGKPIVQFNMKEGRFSAGEASLYADNENGVPDFAAKILWLLDHPEERKKMGEIGLQRVANELAWEYSVEHLLAAYQRAFSKR
jgi:glycosyltransferase involved in cell wall biosynthesis